MRIAINGMGRIGRLLFRRLINHPRIELVAVNDIMPFENLRYLLKYDSVYGTFNEEVINKENFFSVYDKKIKVMREARPENLPWGKQGVDVVLECSGKFTSRKAASQHLKAGTQKVLLSTAGSDDIPLMIYGFNHSQLLKDEPIISPGGCMTNCSIHILSLLQPVGIRSVHLNILHSYTSRQELVDGPHTDFRRGRAASESIIPVPVDLHQSITRLMPGLKDKIATLSTRVPVANGAMADFSIQLNADVSAAVVNTLFSKAAKNEYKGVLAYTEDPLVSLDIKGNTHSCIVDGTLTSVTGNHLKVIAWFDNEYGFTSRMIDWLEFCNNNPSEQQKAR